MKLRTFFQLVGIGALVAVAVAAAAIRRSDSLRWRFQVVEMAAAGEVPDLSVSDAVRMVLPNSGYSLEALPSRPNAYATIKNPRTSDMDLHAGRETFRGNCAACHGADARGGTGPALVNRRFTHGESDWALLRTIKYGVPGTSMPPHPWAYTRIWQAVTYIRSLDASHPREASEAAPKIAASIAVPYDELKGMQQPGKDWLMYGGAYSGTRHSSLASINRDNVAKLAPRWIHQFKRIGNRIQMTPLVRDGIMYVSHAGSVMALDAGNGTIIWEFDRQLPSDALACCGLANRGVTLLGERVFVGTVDARLIALSARTGRKLWETVVAPDYAEGLSITSAPLAFDNLVVTGVGGGDYPTRGFIAAFDVETGREKWRFATIPGPGEPGHETWPGDSWRTGGGSTWLTGSYDPVNDIVFWGIGNPAPQLNTANRKGDNLYTDSVVALRGATGEKLWYFQFTPADDHDWDSVQTPVLIERPQSAAPHQLIWANRNGFFYVLNRVNGQFLRGTQFVKQTWARGLDANGRPIRIPGSSPSPRGTLVWPGAQGATNWWSPSYDPDLDLMFIPALEHANIYYSAGNLRARSRELFLAGYTEAVPGVPRFQEIVAVRSSDATVAWTYKGPQSADLDLHIGGLTSTAGGLVFGSNDQTFYALDSRDGKLLWSFPTGAHIASAAVAYTVGTEQLVSISSGRDLITFGLVGGQ